MYFDGGLVLPRRYLTPVLRSSRGVRAERARGRELAELVPDHRLRDEDRHVLAAVVHGDRVPDHVRHDRRTARPGLDDPLVAALVHVVDLHHQVLVDERTLLHRPRHLATTLPTAANDVLARRLVLLPRTAFLLAPRATSDDGRRRTCPRRRPAGGRRGSSPHRGRTDACSSSGCGRPCRARSARARGCPPRPRCPCTSRRPGGSRRREAAGSRTRPPSPSAGRWCPPSAPSWRRRPASARSRGSPCRPGCCGAAARCPAGSRRRARTSACRPASTPCGARM